MTSHGLRSPAWLCAPAAACALFTPERVTRMGERGRGRRTNRESSFQVSGERGAEGPPTLTPCPAAGQLWDPGRSLPRSVPQPPPLGNGGDGSTCLSCWDKGRKAGPGGPLAHRGLNTYAQGAFCKAGQSPSSNFSKRKRAEEAMEEGDHGEERAQ